MRRPLTEAWVSSTTHAHLVLSARFIFKFSGENYFDLFKKITRDDFSHNVILIFGFFWNGPGMNQWIIEIISDGGLGEFEYACAVVREKTWTLMKKSYKIKLYFNDSRAEFSKEFLIFWNIKYSETFCWLLYTFK